MNERHCANEQSFDTCLSEGRRALVLEQHVYTLCLCGVAKITQGSTLAFFTRSTCAPKLKNVGAHKDISSTMKNMGGNKAKIVHFYRDSLVLLNKNSRPHRKIFRRICRGLPALFGEEQTEGPKTERRARRKEIKIAVAAEQISHPKCFDFSKHG